MNSYIFGDLPANVLKENIAHDFARRPPKYSWQRALARCDDKYRITSSRTKEAETNVAHIISNPPPRCADESAKELIFHGIYLGQFHRFREILRRGPRL